MDNVLVEKALEALREIKDECGKEKKGTVPPCPHCGGGTVVRNGHKHGKQAYLCRNCEKSFVETTKTGLFNSRSGEAVWLQAARDTVNGVPIDRTAWNLGLRHETVFNMRHKILYCLEQEENREPARLEGVCEADGTYILESLKGTKLPPDFWRKSRKHGAKAEKRGLPNEYICVCAGVEREGNALPVAVNRATAGKDGIKQVSANGLATKPPSYPTGQKGTAFLPGAGLVPF